MTAAAVLLTASGASAAGWRPAFDVSAPQFSMATDDICMPSPFPIYCWIPGAATVDVAANEGGDIVVVWKRREGQTMHVQARVRPAGGTFSRTYRVGTAFDYPRLDYGPAPDVAVDDAGNAIVVWAEEIDGVTRIRASVRPRGGGFGPAINLSPAGQDAHEDPRVAMNGAGHGIVVWTLHGVAVQSRSWRPASGFSATSTMAAGGALYTARAAINDAGAAAVTWDWSPQSSGYTVRARVRPAGQSVFAPIQIVSGPGPGPARSDVAVEPGGRAIVVWRGDLIQARRLTAAGRLGSGIEDLASPPYRSTLPAIAVDGAGTAVASWTECGPDPPGCITRTVRGRAGARFGPLRTVPAPDGQSAKMAVDGTGTATFVWESGFRVRAVRGAPDGAFVDARVLTTSDDRMSPEPAPTVAADGNGSAIAAWIFSRPDNREVVQVAVYDGGAPRLSDVVVPRRARRAKPVSMRVAASDALTGVQVGWRFGDGAAASGASAQHSYRRCGRYGVTITARDAAANTATVRRRLLVVAPRCRIRSRIVAAWRVNGARTTITRLRARRVPEEARLQVRCLGRGCTFKRRTAARRRDGSANLLRALRGVRTLRAGQTLEVRIAKPGYRPKVVRYRIRTARPPRRATR